MSQNRQSAARALEDVKRPHLVIAAATPIQQSGPTRRVYRAIRNRWTTIFCFALALLFLFSLTVDAQTRLQTVGPSRPLLIQECGCQRPTWHQSCDPAGMCSADTPSSGCDRTCGICENCGLALLQVNQSLDAESPLAFYVWFQKSGRVVVSKAGPLAKYGVREGDHIRTINKWKPTKARFAKWAKRRNPMLRIRIYKPDTKKQFVFYARP